MSSAIFTRRGPRPESASGKLAWRGWTVRGSRGEMIGKIEEIYVADETAVPDWALVRGDGPRGTTSFRSPNEAPLDGAWEVVIAAEQKLTAELSRAWQQ